MSVSVGREMESTIQQAENRKVAIIIRQRQNASRIILIYFDDDEESDNSTIQYNTIQYNADLWPCIQLPPLRTACGYLLHSHRQTVDEVSVSKPCAITYANLAQDLRTLHNLGLATHKHFANLHTSATIDMKVRCEPVGP